ncbi:MAG TPA: cyclic lactone autoinducer peptide [Enterococcus sp.]|uniref:Cyclic lactone autoinducer peptide n=1 Tax=Enterococcus malodoratus ATCC 43197 TaxID=1158601 RepID=R2NPE0_9ENTE|nr:cyclic lactone autoinducer peptide [Enterococcus malodoratus ATCC 43197]EOT67406.1 hypothetical protein I585_02927 [Enterococcus malodoratus ATCC 43197]SPX03136.1 Uncharacterised protein [Enterococcus malodoratus]STD69342.1 Uncharacterised protein [Enterococcus malodoratus]HCM84758.1 cyclic lactone autoinducer peptide [Enterococcus sp.]
MKTIKINRNFLLRNISKILVATSVVLLSRPCLLWGYEPENPKLKKLNIKE